MKRLHPPVSEETLRSLKAGEKVLISGTVYTARDQAHIRLIEEKNLPFDLKGAVIYYVGPTPAKENQVIGAAGPTSAYRMDELAVPLMKKGVRVMIGKGDRSKAFQEAMQKHNAVYMMAVGGAGALLASRIKRKKLLLYEELGTEAVYALTVEDFPCFVAYDLHGNSIFAGDRK